MKRPEFSLALDLGTTTLAAALVDAGGDFLARARLPNPQAKYGTDILRRLEAAAQGAAAELQQLLVSGIESLVDDLCRQSGCDPSQVTRGAVAANPAIMHLLLKLDGSRLLFPPHRPLDSCGRTVSFASLGGRCDFPLYLFPLVSGFVGGDLVAFLFGRTGDPDRCLYIDVGTNAEMALRDGERWWTTSVAAGPAFEGGEIRSGMRAADGAIDRVRATPTGFEVGSLGGVPPRGLCGSGLVEAVAASLEVGLIDAAGQILPALEVETAHSRLVVEEQERSIRLYRDAASDVLLGQGDVRQFQLAKAAVRAGVLCLLQKAGEEKSPPDRIILTGAFGFSLFLPALKRVVMLPENMVDRVLFVQDGALEGLRLFLARGDASQELALFCEKLKSYPLSGTPAFERAFLASMGF